MTRTKTVEALIALEDAAAARASNSPAIVAAVAEERAVELLRLAEPPTIGAGGEAVPEPAEPGQRAAILRETLGRDANAISTDASAARANLLLGAGSNVAAMALDAAVAIGSGSSVERMLGHQMGACHDAAMRYLAKSHEQSDSVEAARFANVAARFMSVYQEGLLALQRLRTGGNQLVTVQHVNVQPGAQAIVGNVSSRRGCKAGGVR